jgi:hypothetical protein
MQSAGRTLDSPGIRQAAVGSWSIALRLHVNPRTLRADLAVLKCILAAHRALSQPLISLCGPHSDLGGASASCRRHTLSTEPRLGGAARYLPLMQQCAKSLSAAHCWHAPPLAARPHRLALDRTGFRRNTYTFSDDTTGWTWRSTPSSDTRSSGCSTSQTLHAPARPQECKPARYPTGGTSVRGAKDRRTGSQHMSPRRRSLRNEPLLGWRPMCRRPRNGAQRASIDVMAVHIGSSADKGHLTRWISNTWT